jgi:hypothetical protein
MGIKVSAQSVVQSAQKVKHVGRAIVQLHVVTTVQEIMLIGLGDGEQAIEDLRVAFQLAAVDLEGSCTGDYHDVTIEKPKI